VILRHCFTILDTSDASHWTDCKASSIMFGSSYARLMFPVFFCELSHLPISSHSNSLDLMICALAAIYRLSAERYLSSQAILPLARNNAHHEGQRTASEAPRSKVPVFGWPISIEASSHNFLTPKFLTSVRHLAQSLVSGRKK